MNELTGPIDRLHNRSPDSIKTGFFTSHDGKRLRYALASPARPETKGTVVFISGRSEFIEKYFETISDMNAAGFAVATFDLRGQGGSDRISNDPLAGHVDRFSDYTDDTRCFFDSMVKEQLPGPYFLMGHSLGGLIALSTAAKQDTDFQGLILSAPFVALKDRELPEPAIRLLSVLAGILGFCERSPLRHKDPPVFEKQILTSDPIRYERNLATARKNPPYMLGAPTYGWLRACLGEAAQMRKAENLQKITIPVLVLTASQDQVIPPDAQIRVGQKLNAKIVNLPEAKHDILQESDTIRSAALAAIFAFLNETIATR